jgi:hypothetical protein
VHDAEPRGAINQKQAPLRRSQLGRLQDRWIIILRLPEDLSETAPAARWLSNKADPRDLMRPFAAEPCGCGLIRRGLTRKSFGARMRGIRSWISVASSFASVVITANMRTHSPDVGSFHKCRQYRTACRPSSLLRRAASRAAPRGVHNLDTLPGRQNASRHRGFSGLPQKPVGR